MRKEIIRKLIHLTGYWNLLAYVLFSYYIGSKFAILFLTIALLVFLELEYLRVEHKILRIPNYFNIFRKKEQSHFGGHIFMTLAAIVSFAAFSEVIALSAFSMTILGDFFSALVGKKWGKHKFIFSNKTGEGSLAGFAGNLIAGYIFLSYLPNFLYILIPMAVTATLVEVYTQKLDDNLTVAIFSGVMGQVMFLLF